MLEIHSSKLLEFGGLNKFHITSDIIVHKQHIIDRRLCYTGTNRKNIINHVKSCHLMPTWCPENGTSDLHGFLIRLGNTNITLKSN
jgi:hypothetical protein